MGILIVRNFPNALSEELPGSSSDCEIEFVIELLSGSALVSKVSYCMDSHIKRTEDSVTRVPRQ